MSGDIAEKLTEIAKLDDRNWMRHRNTARGWSAEAAATITSQAREIERMREALEPFAKHYGPDYPDLDHKGQPLPDEQDVGWTFLKIGDFRRARAAIRKETTE